MLRLAQIPHPKMYEDIDQWNFIFSDKYWIIKIGLPSSTESEPPRIRWPFECWLAGEKVNDGNVEVPPPHTTTKAIAKLLKAGSISLLEDISTKEASSLLDYQEYELAHGPMVPDHEDEHLVVCANCKGRFYFDNPLRGQCPGEGAIHGVDVSSHNCEAFDKWQSCRHTFHACECNDCTSAHTYL